MTSFLQYARRSRHFTACNAVTPNMGGSGVASSGGGGGGAEETANEIDWISRKLELLEDNLSKLADKAADAYEPWINRPPSTRRRN